MCDIYKLYAELEYAVDNPGAMVTKYLGEGKKVIGCFPIYIPGEIIHAAGMIPFGLWGGQCTPSVSGQYSPIATCSIMHSCLEFGMTGKYDGMSAAVMPMLCDTFRGMSAAWRVGVKNIPLISFIHPQNRESAGAPEFLSAEYNRVKADLEAVGGCKITDQALAGTIKLYNEHNALMREFAKIANDHLDIITANVRHVVLKSSHFMEKSEHMAIVSKLIALLKERSPHKWEGRKIVLTGITGEPKELLDYLTEYNIAVVGDDLAQESRQFRTDIPEGSNPMESLARQWLLRRACSVIHETKSTRGELVVSLAKENGADGVAYCLMKFCDVEEYDYPMVMSAAKAAGLPVLTLEIEQNTDNNQQSKTKIQSFAEML